MEQLLICKKRMLILCILFFMSVISFPISTAFADDSSIAPVESVRVIKQEDGNEEEPAYILTGHGDLFVPLRAVAEKIGFTVIWDQTTRSAEVIIGDQLTTVKPDIDVYQYNDMEPVSLGIAPVLIDNKLYVVSEYFVDVLQLSVDLETGTGAIWIHR